MKIILFEFLLFDEMSLDKIVFALTYVILYALEHEIIVKSVELSKMSIDNVDRASNLVHLDSIEDNEQSNLNVENTIQEQINDDDVFILKSRQIMKIVKALEIARQIAKRQYKLTLILMSSQTIMI